MGKKDNQVLEKKLRVKNACGLHTRPATMIVQCLQKWQAEVAVSYKKKSVDAKSILNLLLLAVPKNGEITVTAKGVDAEQVLLELSNLFADYFGEKK